jgi:catechol 2,3-dioxygenase-like lactoylglutathione lyase family enzyme
MAVELNHIIIPATDAPASAAFLAGILGLEAGARWGPFTPVEVANGVTLDYDHSDDVHPHHCAFLVSEAEFDGILGRIRDGGVPYFADPFGRQPSEINHHDGGRGVYFTDPDGHLMEAITRPYGDRDDGG